MASISIGLHPPFGPLKRQIHRAARITSEVRIQVTPLKVGNAFVPLVALEAYFHIGMLIVCGQSPNPGKSTVVT